MFGVRVQVSMFGVWDSVVRGRGRDSVIRFRVWIQGR